MLVPLQGTPKGRRSGTFNIFKLLFFLINFLSLFSKNVSINFIKNIIFSLFFQFPLLMERGWGEGLIFAS